MIKLSEMALQDAIAQGNSRFKTLRNIKYSHTISMDKYSIEMAVSHQGNDKVMKVLLDSGGERAEAILLTAQVLEKLKLPYVVKAEVLEKELTVITTDNQSYISDVILIDHITTPVFDVDNDDDGRKMVGGYLNLVTELLHNGYIFDLLSMESFRYDDGKVLLSMDTNFIFDGTVNTDLIKNRAFSNYLIMIYLRLLIESHNDRTVGDKINYDKNITRFDLRILNDFVSPEYRRALLTLMKLLEKYSDYDCSYLRDSIDMMNFSDTVSALFNITSVGDRSEIFSYIGNHAEDRIAVRGTKSEKFGYVNFDWEKAIDFEYDDASDFVEGVAVCRKGDYYGAINRFGETIVPFEYEFLEWHSERNLFIWRKSEQTMEETPRWEFLKN